MLKVLNLHVENWSMLDCVDTSTSEVVPQITDVVSLADDISNTNNDTLCDMNDHQYIN